VQGEDKVKDRISKLFELFMIFFKIGAFTFGGGYAMIPFIQKEVSENKGWISDEDIFEIIAIAESTPGPIAINAATFVGSKVKGFWGAFFATFGVVLPSFIIILIISFVLKEFQEIKIVQYAFYGIRAGVLALIIKALVSMYKQAPKNIIAYIIMAFAFVAAAILGVNVLFVIIGSALIGLVASYTVLKEERK